ncbi:MAG: VCBS repeat-containing protein [Candidatus Cloacimonetes bacterium]|nr:VCBS repeat-containing protein [Candidatus Cloacimonadota bacterium]MDY0229861.1 VCBS repeat-containing protein [Candidatus Cloacimonadaceae bacterium]
MILDIIRLPYLYKNDGNDVFTQTSVSLPNGSAVDWGDYNNDGYLDILINGSSPVVFKNNGDGTFTSISVSGCTGYGGGWGDYDNDGDLDIHIAGYSGSRLFRNDGNDTFYNTGINWGGSGYGYSSFCDYDNDGDSDYAFYSQNTDDSYSASSVEGLPGLHPSHATMAFGDYDNDGYLDYLTSGETGWGYSTHSLLRNNHNGTVSLVATGIPTVYNSLVKWGDFDNDGLLDILSGGHGETKIYKNEGNGSFSNTTISFPDAVHGRAAWGDYNGDGVLDLAVHGNIYKGVSSATNTAPQVPSNLQAVEEGNYIILSWDASSDQETPSLGLNYALRAGATPGSRDLISPESDDSGYRQAPKNGPANGQCFWKIRKDHMPENGRFYWSVQAIDGAFAGSPWAQ